MGIEMAKNKPKSKAFTPSFWCALVRAPFLGKIHNEEESISYWNIKLYQTRPAGFEPATYGLEMLGSRL